MNSRLYRYMNENNFDLLILCQPDNIAYCTGFDTPVSYGASDNTVNGAFTYAVVSAKEEHVTLIAADCCYGSAKAGALDFVTVEKFDTFDFFVEHDAYATLDAVMSAELKQHVGVKRIGIEPMRFPYFLQDTVKNVFPDAQYIDANPLLVEARKVKSPYEIARIKRSVAIEDAGQLKLLEYARNFNGESEFEIYSGVYKAMNEAAGRRVTLTGDFATGPRIRSLSGVVGPIERKIQRGDLGIFDMSIRVDGYWCDCTNTVCFGASPNAEQLKYFTMVKEAFNAGLEVLYPGTPIKALDKAVSDVFRKYGKEPVVYTGHQIGCNVNELPRLLCYQDGVLEEDMVVCVEPQNYTNDDGNTGIRLEKVIHITKNGPVVLNQYPWGLD